MSWKTCLVAYSFSLLTALLVEFILGGIVIGHFYGKFKNRKSPLTKGVDTF